MLPNINQLLYMQINSMDEEESRQEYKSRIADISESEIAIEVPLNEQTGRLKRLVLGDELFAHFLTGDGYKHFFSTTVTGFREDSIPLVTIRKPEHEEITKIQRRNFVRVAADLELSLQYSDENFMLVTTQDVGGGGLSFYSDANTAFTKGRSIPCWLLLPLRSGKIEHVKFIGEIIREKPIENKVLCMLRFIDIADKERQKIIRFCFERQIDYRKN